MGETSVFRFLDYRAYLESKVEAHQKQRGYKTQLAKAAGFGPSFLSQVLSGTMDINNEHAHGLAKFWNLTPPEREYFLTLVQHARAGTHDLKKTIAEKLARMRRENQDVPRPSEESAPIEFYSHADNALIRAWLAVKGMDTVKALSQKTGLPPDRVEWVLGRLKTMGLAHNEGDRWVAEDKHLSMPADSPWMFVDHLNWWAKAASGHRPVPGVTHQQKVVAALSRKQIVEIRARLLAAIKDILEIAERKDEPPEEVVCLIARLFLP